MGDPRCNKNNSLPNFFTYQTPNGNPRYTFPISIVTYIYILWWCTDSVLLTDSMTQRLALSY